MTQALDEIKIGGMGASRKRVEDNRFIRGKGNYTDDIHLPGMLHMEILRSPVAHARITKIDASRAWEIPGVHLVLTGDMMATRNLAWMPTLSYDTQAVLATDKVRFQGQEVACVIADDPYIAKDACEAIEIDYEPLPVVVSPQQAAAAAAPVIRDDKENQDGNVIYDWEVGDAEGTDQAFEQADVISRLQLHYPRSHPSPIECCGSIADFNRSTSKLTVYMTTQAPHIIRAAVALVAELPEHMIRIISPDIGGGFGNKVPVYPGYVCSILASILLERPVKWIEDKTGNLISTGFARDVYLDGELALRRDGKILGMRMRTLADHGAFFSDAQPSKFKIGLMHSTFGCYDVPVAHLAARGMYTNKAPGGVAYRCSFRVTEAMFFQERMMHAAANDLGMDQAEFRRINLVRDEQFPHRTPFGFLLDSGQYRACLDLGLKAVGYAAGAAVPPITHTRITTRPGEHPLLEFMHPALGVAGLGCWIAFVITGFSVFAWAAFGVIIVTIAAGLTWYTVNARAARAARSGREPGVSRDGTGEPRAAEPGAGAGGRVRAPARRYPARRLLVHGSGAAATFVLALVTALAAHHA